MKPLLKDAKGCIHCGTPTGFTAENIETRAPTPLSYNRIMIQETRSRRTVEATFSDNVAMHVAGLWSQGTPLANGNALLKETSLIALGDGASENWNTGDGSITGSEGEVIEVEAKEGADDTPNLLLSFFDGSNDKLTLLDTSLKADTVKESRVRATLLALRYSEIKNGQPTLSRDVLIGIMREAS